MYYTEEQQPQQGGITPEQLQTAEQHLAALGDIDSPTRDAWNAIAIANGVQTNQSNAQRLGMAKLLQEQYEKDMLLAQQEYARARAYEDSYNQRAFELQKKQSPERFSDVKDFQDPKFLERVQYYMRDENGDITSYNPGRATMRQVQPPKMTGLQMQPVKFQGLPRGGSGSKDPGTRTPEIDNKPTSDIPGLVREAVTKDPDALQNIFEQFVKREALDPNNPSAKVFDKADASKIFGDSATLYGVGDNADAQTMAFAMIARGVAELRSGNSSDALSLLAPLANKGAQVFDANGNANFRIPKPKKMTYDENGAEVSSEQEISNPTDMYDKNNKTGRSLKKNYKEYFDGLVSGAADYIYNSPLFQDPTLRQKVMSTMKDSVIVNGKEWRHNKEGSMRAVAEALASAVIYRAAGIKVIGDKGLPTRQPQQQGSPGRPAKASDALDKMFD